MQKEFGNIRIKIMLKILLLTIGIFVYMKCYAVGALMPSDAINYAKTSFDTLNIIVIILGIFFLIDFVFIIISIKNKKTMKIIITSIIALLCVFAVWYIPVSMEKITGGYKGMNIEQYFNIFNIKIYEK